MLPGHASASGAGQLQADTTCATPQPEVKSASWDWKLDGCSNVIASGGVHLLGCITRRSGSELVPLNPASAGEEAGRGKLQGASHIREE